LDNNDEKPIECRLTLHSPDVRDHDKRDDYGDDFMICKIDKIRQFGVFEDFSWPADLAEFKRLNLIYGWNYSGKTTLSRAFRCFELGEPHPDFDGAFVRLKNEDGSICELSNLNNQPPFRVFNSDFVRSHLSFEESTASPILVLGAEDISRQEDLKARDAELQKVGRQKVVAETERSDITRALSKGLSSSARDLIKNPLGVPNYDKTKFEPLVMECSTDPARYLLHDDALDESLVVYHSADKRPSLVTKELRLTPIADLVATATELLKRVVSGGKSLKRLEGEPTIERWVSDGRPLHADKDTCQYCGRPLPSELTEELRLHFSKDYDDLLARLGEHETLIRKVMEEAPAFDSKADFYPELAADFAASETRFGDLLSCRRASLSELLGAIENKKTQAFSPVVCPSLADPHEDLSEELTAINAMIGKHNARTTLFEQKRDEAFEALKRHYAAQFAKEHEYGLKKQTINDLDVSIGKMDQRIETLKQEIEGLRESLSEASQGAARINDLLAASFGKDDLRVIVSDDDRFHIRRGEKIAKNLSEGERTALAFAHFVTRLQDGAHPLEQTIVVVDDPVCSLDSNHVFNTYAVIKTILADCHQLFVLTHSFAFYNLIREWALDSEKKWRVRPMTDWKTWGIYYCQRHDDGAATLTEIPRELIRFKSEYHYLFAMLYEFHGNDDPDFDRLLGLPNVVRRFLEAFGGIMIPLCMGLQGKMARLFPNEVERERVWRFVNYFSHNTTITRSLSIPDLSECRTVVASVIALIKRWNEDYFNDLQEEVALGTPSESKAKEEEA